VLRVLEAGGTNRSQAPLPCALLQGIQCAVLLQAEQVGAPRRIVGMLECDTAGTRDWRDIAIGTPPADSCLLAHCRAWQA